jgi:5-formyltetrahydrofolate cyclo-ligase
MAKAILRRRALQKRKRLKPHLRARQSAAIRRRLFRDARWASARTVLCYISNAFEVDTHTLIKQALAARKRIVVPVTNVREKKIILSRLRRWPDLTVGPYGILQPAPRFIRRVAPKEVDLALVPGVLFDRRGGRIGFGGGYFDKLLAQMQRATRIGLAFSFQVRKQALPREAHDIAMHAIVTEKEVINIE